LAIYLNFIRNWKSIMKLKPQKIVQIEKINWNRNRENKVMKKIKVVKVVIVAKIQINMI
jgi:hypothetical protein